MQHLQCDGGAVKRRGTGWRLPYDRIPIRKSRRPVSVLFCQAGILRQDVDGKVSQLRRAFLENIILAAGLIIDARHTKVDQHHRISYTLIFTHLIHGMP
jgi:hypothetical protein